eukprot:CAMPEP_0167744094 /NCGR_PEP_ID=MMETSP0110_2-20121227/2387_1 /TAXON_ID=629695 /ORGANISM="Gymnochlora sp., Strain CCMP2014" /LENGTH=357 /DNA_ID=CAMNT_0007628551 /DNA_START=197 /DNA_END=1267 /DNA_ORIENTATION=+
MGGILISDMTRLSSGIPDHDIAHVINDTSKMKKFENSKQQRSSNKKNDEKSVIEVKDGKEGSSTGVETRQRLATSGENGEVFGASRWPWQLLPFENAVIWFAVLAFGVPSQAFNAILSLLTLRVSALIYAIVVVIAAISVVWYFSSRIKAEAMRILESGKELEEQARSSTVPERLEILAITPAKELGAKRRMCGIEIPEFSVWVSIIWISCLLLGAATIALLFGGGSVIYVAVPLLLPFALLVQMLTASFDGYLFMHPEDTSSDVQYWIQVFQVAVNGPVLLVNWFALDMTNSEEGQLAVVVGVTVVVYIVVGIYYGFIDPFMPSDRSLTVQIPRVRETYKNNAKNVRSLSICNLDM